jgi:hypothetical protein
LEIAPYLPKLGHNLKLVNDRDVPAIVGDGAYTGTRKSHHLAAGAGAGYPWLSGRYGSRAAGRLSRLLWFERRTSAAPPLATQPFPSLKPFDFHICVDDDLGAAVSSKLETWPETIRRTKARRAVVEAELHPRIVAAAWHKALRLAAALASTTPKRSAIITEVRLNIGCGDKLLPHYIYMDATGDRQGPKPDMVCDARNLSSFVAGSVDKILSVHLIEHLAR